MPIWIQQGALLTFAIFFACKGRAILELLPDRVAPVLVSAWAFLFVLAWVILVTDAAILVEWVVK